MAKSARDPVVVKLDEILTVLQDLLIIEGERVGLDLKTVRTILRTDRTRVSATWKHLKALRKE